MKETLEKHEEQSHKLLLSEEAYRVLPSLLFILVKEHEDLMDFNWDVQKSKKFVFGPTFPFDQLQTLFEESQVTYEEII